MSCSKIVLSIYVLIVGRYRAHVAHVAADAIQGSNADVVVWRGRKSAITRRSRDRLFFAVCVCVRFFCGSIAARMPRRVNSVA